ncbi:hypothetical protein GCM10007301_21920 [Azorhizobium oxalatiphilum]|uniref:GYF domain-containing protein n=1 Tax=Azorhizobium oxalatiphilum TaxID=980631 RepID=A0A917FBD3_9HYPH|nr:DUF805 domain-containing protein [Azorhizobium oxalatiphilum]GGF61791.1 hypothetical protein GCM10007301_21920 [Azorhizobium oxalatiphilum]
MAGHDEWFYGANGEQKGPYSTEQMKALLQAGAINSQTVVWTAGMAGWLPLAQSPLATASAGGPPQIPGGYAPQGGGVGNGAVGGGGIAPGPRPVGMGEAVKRAFSQYFTFSGRASRSEFWYFALFCLLAAFVLGMVDLMVFSTMLEDGVSPLSNLFSLAVIIPQIALSARRLHDTDRSGWWYLLLFVPLIGIIVLIVFWASQGTQGRNRFG